MRRLTPRGGAFGGKAPLSGLVPVSSAAAGPSPLTRRAGAAGLATALALLPVPPTAALDPDGGADSDRPQATVAEELTVTDTRLYAEPDDRQRVPAHVTVIERETIERSGARTLQDLLSLEAGVVVFDQIGNDVQKSFDLRGFSGGSGTRVFLDGAPLNEPRNNGVPLELVPLQALDRVEITRGSVTALAGGGSEAGVINLWTRRAEGGGGAVSAATGDFSTHQVDANVSGDFGALDLFVSGAWEETDGFRDNAGGELERWQGSLGLDLGPRRRLTISLHESSDDLGTPGALTLAESAEDPSQAPFNQLDFIAEDLTQAAANFAATLSRSLSLQANVYARDREDEILTTGRAAPAFGGFASGTEASVAGATLQLALGNDTEAGSNRLVVGAEWLDGDTDATGYFTTPEAPGTIGPAGLFSDNTAQRETLGLYAQDTWQAARRLTLSLGARWDDDRVGYDERFPDPGNDGDRDFSELSLRGGVSWALSGESSLYLSYGEAFRPPTVEDLFSFPLFGSNPGLEPEDSTSWELGWRRRLGRRLDLDAVLFRIRSVNEIVFDPDSDLGLFGANVNAGEARREGIELALTGRTGGRFRPFATLTLLEAELRNGEHRGNRLPLVPEERLTLGADVDLTRGVTLRVEGLHVGDQVLDNDDANAQAELDAYDVVNLRASWRPSPRSGRAGSGGRARGLLVFVEARNLFDESYATRGIYAFDFSTFVDEVFVTPAPGRRVMGGLGWEF